MSSKHEDSINLELIEGESIISVLPDKSDQQQTDDSYSNIFLLTTKRLVVISKANQEKDLTFIDIRDVDRITMESISSNRKVIARAALMATGALCSIYIIQIMAIALTIAMALGMGAAYLLIDSRNQRKYETLSVFTNHTSLVMPYQKDQHEQAIDFVNACFNVKSTTEISVQDRDYSINMTNQEPLIPDTPHT